MEPARSIIKALGGVKATAAIVGVHRTRVSNWMRPRAVGGTNGAVPHWHIPKILEHARTHDVPLSETDFAPRTASDLARSTHPTAPEATP